MSFKSSIFLENNLKVTFQPGINFWKCLFHVSFQTTGLKQMVAALGQVIRGIWFFVQDLATKLTSKML